MREIDEHPSKGALLDWLTTPGRGHALLVVSDYDAVVRVARWLVVKGCRVVARGVFESGDRRLVVARLTGGLGQLAGDRLDVAWTAPALPEEWRQAIEGRLR